MDIIDKIRMLCNEKVITIAELERNLGLGAGTVSRWNVRVPGVDKVQKVADYFSVTTDYLLGRIDTPNWATEEDVLDIERALHLNSTAVVYDGIELTEDEKEQVGAIIRGVLWKHLKNKKIGRYFRNV